MIRARKASNITTWVGRKKKAVHKTTSTDDKRLQNTLKRLGVNTIPGIEEVNIFLESDLINFTNPKGARSAVCSAAICGPVKIHVVSTCAIPMPVRSMWLLCPRDVTLGTTRL